MTLKKSKNLINRRYKTDIWNFNVDENFYRNSNLKLIIYSEIKKEFYNYYKNFIKDFIIESKPELLENTSLLFQNKPNLIYFYINITYIKIFLEIFMKQLSILKDNKILQIENLNKLINILKKFNIFENYLNIKQFNEIFNEIFFYFHNNFINEILKNNFIILKKENFSVELITKKFLDKKKKNTFSSFRFQLLQQLQSYYGFSNFGKFKRLIKINNSPTNKNKTSLNILENRFENLIYKFYFSNSIFEARDLIKKGYYKINNFVIKYPNYKINLFDIININDINYEKFIKKRIYINLIKNKFNINFFNFYLFSFYFMYFQPINKINYIDLNTSNSIYISLVSKYSKFI